MPIDKPHFADPTALPVSMSVSRKRYVAKVGINYKDIRVEPGDTVPDVIINFGTAEADLLAGGAIEPMD